MNGEDEKVGGGVSGLAGAGAIDTSIQREMVVVRIDRHRARNTGARTFWTMPKGAQKIWTTKKPLKTHWFEYWLVPSSSILYRHRISNRGNYTRQAYNALQLVARFDEIPEGML